MPQEDGSTASLPRRACQAMINLFLLPPPMARAMVAMPPSFIVLLCSGFDDVRVVKCCLHRRNRKMMMVWLWLASSKRPLISLPLSVGDPVKVMSGHYRGEQGTIQEPMDEDTCKFGMTLRGYTGIGYVDATSLEWDKTLWDALEARRKAKKEARRKAREEWQQKRLGQKRRREQRKMEWEVMRKYYGPYEEFWSMMRDDSDDEEKEEEEDSDGEDDGNDGDDMKDKAKELAGRLFGGTSSSYGGIDNKREDMDETYEGPLWITVTTTPFPKK